MTRAFLRSGAVTGLLVLLLFPVVPVSRASEKNAAQAGEETEIRQIFSAAEAVFSADIKSASLERMGLGGPPVPMSKVFFENVTLLKGERPETEKSSYLYRETPDKLERFREHRVLVALETAPHNKKTFLVRAILPAEDRYFRILESLEAGCSEEKPADCSGAGTEGQAGQEKEKQV